MKARSKLRKAVLIIILISSQILMYSCADRLCSAYTGQAYIGHGTAPKALKK